MSDDDLKRLIMQFEHWQSTGIKNFNDDDVIDVLRELLTVRQSMNEIKDIVDNSQL